MNNRKDTFAKRRREVELKDRARAKQERRLAKRNEPRAVKGPEIAWDEAVHVVPDGTPAAPEVVPPVAVAAADAASTTDPADPTSEPVASRADVVRAPPAIQTRQR